MIIWFTDPFMLNSDAVPQWLYADPDPPNLVSADPDPWQ